MAKTRSTIGSGEEGFDDGDFKKASFNRPQGIYLSDDTLFVADTENHAIRAVDLKAGNVTTIAGIGTQAPRLSPPGLQDRPRLPPLCSPWDVIQIPGDKALYIAMAGPHQIWKLDLDRRRGERFRRYQAAKTSWTVPPLRQLRPAERPGDRRRKPVCRRLRGLGGPRDHRDPKPTGARRPHDRRQRSFRFRRP